MSEAPQPEPLSTAEILAATNLALSETLSLDAVLDKLLDHLGALVPFDTANVMLLEGTRLVVRAFRGYEKWTKQDIRGAGFEIGPHGIFRRMVDTRRSVLIPDTRKDPDWQRHTGTEYVLSWIGVPLVAEGEFVGLYALDKAEADFFTERHLEVTQALAQQAVVAVRNARLFAREHEAREQAERLHWATLALSASMDLEVVLGLILRELRKVVGYDRACVQQLDAGGDHLLIIASEGFTEPERLRGTEIAIDETAVASLQEVIATRTPRVLSDVSSADPDRRRDPHAEAGGRSWLGVPLLFGTRLIGVLSLDRREPGRYTTTHARVAAAFAAQAAAAMENARLYTESQRELSERRKAEDALVQIAERYRLLFESNPLPAWVYDEQTSRILTANGAAISAYGYARSHFLSLYMQDVVASEASEATGGLARHRRRDGSAIDVEVTSEAIQLHQRPARLVIAKDVTERRRLEQLREDLTHTLVHDLRSPLTVVLGTLEALESNPDPATAASLQRGARAGAEKLLSLVNQILEVTRLEEHAFPLERQRIRLDTLVAEALTTVAGAAPGLALQNDVAPDLPAAWADPGVVMRILQNLVGNAVKFTNEGEIRVSAQRLPDDFLMVSVSDTGPGVPDALMGRLFEKFARGPQKGRGTGLGLAFCRLAVEAHGGTLWLNTDREKGATFSFTLPVAQAANGV
jgi:PAS domain S-box-containing protein